MLDKALLVKELRLHHDCSVGLSEHLSRQRETGRSAAIALNVLNILSKISRGNAFYECTTSFDAVLACWCYRGSVMNEL